MKLSEVGEFGLIDLLKKDALLSPQQVIAGIGDDAAVLKSSPGHWQLLTTDMLMEGIHFRLDWSGYYGVGYKALAVNISDVAAMGGNPTHAVISVGIPEHTPVEAMQELYRGFREMAGKYGVNLVGGDTVRSPGPLVINVALLGEVPEGRAIFRSGAKPGDLIYTTGQLGSAAAGLHLLLEQPESPPEWASPLIKAHLFPEPRVTAGRLLSQLAGVSSLDDNSDGLGAELREICRASSVGCTIWEEALPVRQEVRELAEGRGVNYLDWVFNGGEDFELLFTIGPSGQRNVEEALRKAQITFTVIGKITPEDQGLKIGRNNGVWEAITATGYNHFQESLSVVPKE